MYKVKPCTTLCICCKFFSWSHARKYNHSIGCQSSYLCPHTHIYLLAGPTLHSHKLNSIQRGPQVGSTVGCKYTVFYNYCKTDKSIYIYIYMHKLMSPPIVAFIYNIRRLFAVIYSSSAHKNNNTIIEFVWSVWDE